MMGLIDEELRALLDVTISATANGVTQPIQVWIDTAFNAGLVISRARIAALELKHSSSTEAILADGTIAELETFSCFVHWFGKVFRTQVIANDGQFPLLGTQLLASRKLIIDYELSTLSLE